MTKNNSRKGATRNGVRSNRTVATANQRVGVPGTYSTPYLKQIDAPVHIGTAFQPSFVTTSSKFGMRVKGMELLDTAYASTSSTVELALSIGVNPIGLGLTRLQKIAIMYELYRPLHVRIHHVPVVGTSTNGDLVMGTVWTTEGIPVVDSSGAPLNPVNVLMGSNGGTIAPVWASSVMTVDVSTLPQPWFHVSGGLTLESNPFTMCAYSATAGSLGRFLMEYEYEFTQPRMTNEVPTTRERALFAAQAVPETVSPTGHVWQATGAGGAAALNALENGSAVIRAIVASAKEIYDSVHLGAPVGLQNVTRLASASDDATEAPTAAPDGVEDGFAIRSGSDLVYPRQQGDYFLATVVFMDS